MPFDDTMKNVPQADSDAIARRLLGDDLVNRYGDVIGARQPGTADVLRDFTVGFSQGRDKVDELHLKVQEQARKAYNKQAQAAVAAKAQDNETVKTVLSAIKTVQGLPPGQRAAVLKDTLDQAGIPYSNAAIKMFTDADMLSRLPPGTLNELGTSSVISTADIAGVMGSGLNAAKFMESMAQRKRDDQTTQTMILGAEQKRVKSVQDATKFAEWKKNNALKQTGAKLSIKNARLNAQVKEKKLAGDGDYLSGIMAEEEQSVPAPGLAAPTTDKTAEARAKLGL